MKIDPFKMCPGQHKGRFALVTWYMYHNGARIECRGMGIVEQIPEPGASTEIGFRNFTYVSCTQTSDVPNPTIYHKDLFSIAPVDIEAGFISKSFFPSRSQAALNGLEREVRENKGTDTFKSQALEELFRYCQEKYK